VEVIGECFTPVHLQLQGSSDKTKGVYCLYQSSLDGQKKKAAKSKCEGKMDAHTVTVISESTVTGCMSELFGSTSLIFIFNVNLVGPRMIADSLSTPLKA
jgi:hypothetical protein